MNIQELLLEVSRAERERLKKDQARRQRELAAQELERKENLLRQQQEKIKQRQMKKFGQRISDQPEKKSTMSSTWDLDPELSKYIVDPDVDTTFEGGYYLQFHTTNEGVYAYWSINPDSTWEQISRNFGKTQTQFLGSSFDSVQFTKLLKYLINTSGKHGKQGYVQVVITRKNLQSPYFFTKFFNDMISYLARNYPRDEPTADPYVGWEVEK